MSAELVVLLGAGASAAGADYAHSGFHAPLARELFDIRFKEVLDIYRLAAHAAEDIRRELRRGRGIEAILSEDFAGAPPGSQRRKRYREIPLYFQHLLLKVSQAGRTDPCGYRLLINRTLDLESVTFVTLNYDTILDRLLFEHTTLPGSRPADIDDYITQDGWSLIKLHGSVDWARKVELPLPDPGEGREVLGTRWYHLAGQELDAHLGPIVSRAAQLEPGFGTGFEAGLDLFRCSDGALWYPALTVPSWL